GAAFGELARELSGRAAGALLRLALGDLRRAEPLEAAVHDIGDLADHVPGDVADRPSRAASRRVQVGGLQRPQQLAEVVELGEEAGGDLGAVEDSHGAPPVHIQAAGMWTRQRPLVNVTPGTTSSAGEARERERFDALGCTARL